MNQKKMHPLAVGFPLILL